MYYYYYLKRLALQGMDRAIYTISSNDHSSQYHRTREREREREERGKAEKIENQFPFPFSVGFAVGPF